MNDLRECRCGMTFENSTAALIAHVVSPEHEERLRDMGFVQHNHSWRWVNSHGLPVDEGAPNAFPYIKPGCPACERQHG